MYVYEIYTQILLQYTRDTMLSYKTDDMPHVQNKPKQYNVNTGLITVTSLQLDCPFFPKAMLLVFVQISPLVNRGMQQIPPNSVVLDVAYQILDVIKDQKDLFHNNLLV